MSYLTCVIIGREDGSYRSLLHSCTASALTLGCHTFHTVFQLPIQWERESMLTLIQAVVKLRINTFSKIILRRSLCVFIVTDMQKFKKRHNRNSMDAHSVCSCDLVLLPSVGFTAGTARCFLAHRWTCPSFSLPVVFVLLIAAFPSWAQSNVGWQLSLDLVSAFSGNCLDAASFSCVFFAWYINAAKIT